MTCELYQIRKQLDDLQRKLDLYESQQESNLKSNATGVFCDAAVEIINERLAGYSNKQELEHDSIIDSVGKMRAIHSSDNK